MDWIQIFAFFALIVTNLGTVLGLYMHIDNKTSKLIGEIQNEMKDFHGRLCSIEERAKLGK